MEYIKCEEDEHRLRVIGMGVRKMLERELIAINAKLVESRNYFVKKLHLNLW